MNVFDASSQYKEEWHRVYPQVPLSLKIKKQNDELKMFVTIRGERVGNGMNCDDVVAAVAEFKRRGRPRYRYGRLLS